MIRVHFKSLNGGKLSREGIHGWIHSFMSSSYHDNGVETFVNGDAVKIHTFTFPISKIFTEGEQGYIDLRGLDPFENILVSKLNFGDVFDIGSMKIGIIHVDNLGYNIGHGIYEQRYKIVSPIILRISNKNDILFNQLEESDRGFPAWTPEECEIIWKDLLEKSVIKRFEKVYGKDFVDLFEVKDINSKITRLPLYIRGHKKVYKGTLGDVVIKANDNVHEAIQRLGVGNRTSYGCGVLKV